MKAQQRRINKLKAKLNGGVESPLANCYDDLNEVYKSQINLGHIASFGGRKNQSIIAKSV